MVLKNHLQKTFAAREYDLCVVNYTWLSKALDIAPKQTYKVLDTHDKFTGRRQLLAAQGIEKEFFHTTEDQEVIALNRADLVWAIKEEEEEDFIKMGTTAQVSTLLHIDERREATIPNISDRTFFGFIGANNNINQVNIKRFIEQATPIFTQYCAPITVQIAGSICKDLELADNPFFKTVGYIDDINDFYDEIHAAIIPMEFSTGLKIKVAEALSHTKPILSHKHAMEGFTPCHAFHKLESFKEMALAMIDLAYDGSEFKYLKEASLSSHQATEDLIWKELIKVKERIINKKAICVLLPKQYGNHKSLIHYIAQAKIDLVNWNFDNITYVTIAEPSQAMSHANFIRFMTDSEFADFLQNYSPEVLLNLTESFPNIKLPSELRIISLTNIKGLNSSRYLQYHSYTTTAADELYFPSLGHVHVQKEEFDRIIEECWIIGETLENTFRYFLNVIGQGLAERHITINKLKDIDKVLTSANGLPRVIFVTKRPDKLNYSEQIMLELAEKYSIDIRNIYQPQLLIKKRENSKSNYEQQFFPAWERFINEMLNSNYLNNIG